jgi:hypothetical protein
LVIEEELGSSGRYPTTLAARVLEEGLGVVELLRIWEAAEAVDCNLAAEPGAGRAVASVWKVRNTLVPFQYKLEVVQPRMRTGEMVELDELPSITERLSVQ